MKSKYKPRLDSQTSTVYFPLYTDAVRNIEKTADPYRICGFSSAENRTRTDDPFITSDNVTANDNKLYKILVYFAIVKNTKNLSATLRNAVFLRKKCRKSLILRFVHFHNDLQKFCIFKTQV